MSEGNRTDAVGNIIEGLRTTYPDAKKLRIKINFEWQECDDWTAELCPVVDIEIER